MFTLEQTIGLLLGAAFSARTLDGQKPTLARVGYGLVGYDFIATALRGGPLLGNAAPSGAQRTGLAQRAGLSPQGALPKFEERRVRSIEERVKYVHEQVAHGTRDPAVYKLAREVLARKCGGDWCVAEKDHWGEAAALFNEVKKRVRYTFDPTDFDAFQTPAQTLNLSTGDCDDYMSLLGAMLRTVGLKVRSRIVQTTGNATWNHIYLMVFLPSRGGWASLDLSVNQPAGWQVPKSSIIRQQDFEVTETSAPKLPSANFSPSLG